MIDPTCAEALDEARTDISAARDAEAAGDAMHCHQYAQSAIDSAATTLLDPAATDREVVAARYYLREGFSLNGQADSCGVDSINTEREADSLSEEDRQWLDNYLGQRSHDNNRRHDFSHGR